MDSACNPERDTTLFSVEYFSGKVPDSYILDQNKEVYGCEPEGYVVIPPYSAIPRKTVELVDGKVEENYWKDYKSIALEWGNAMSKYKKLKREYESLTGRKMRLTEFFVSPIYKTAKEQLKEFQLKNAYRNVVRQYARIQIADLYAHFSPVELIHDPDILNSDSFNDGLGKTSIWERIKKTGENKFYRVEYSEKNLKEIDKRIEQKEYVEGDGREFLTQTKIADTTYIQNVVNAYSKCDTNSLDVLYKEPIRSDNEQQTVDALIKQFGLTREIRELENLKLKAEIFRDGQIKKDHTKVVIPQKK